MTPRPFPAGPRSAAPAAGLRALPRLLAAVLAACGVVLGLLAAPAAAAPHAEEAPAAASACSPPLGCIPLTSVSNGRNLDVQNGSTGDGAFIVTNSAPGYHQSWTLRVDPVESTFAIANDATGKCITLGWPALRQQTCRNQAGQKWYFQPVAGSHEVFMIRNQSDGSCLDLVADAQYDDAWTGRSICHGRPNQRWSTISPAAFDLAVDRGARMCQKNPSSCSWSVQHEAPAAPLPTVCASPVWFNNTASTAHQTFSVTETTGWSSSIGTTLSSGLTAGTAPALQAAVGTQLTFTNLWQGSSSVGNGIQVSVPPSQYGWVTLSLLARQVTGTWTFDAQGFPWQAEDTVTVPVKDAPGGGATVYSANTAPEFTSCA
ncbi:RICIN domain-containing protein [Streptomyces sp. NPDC047968]|uniref:RICIN domain-containing protein n=1 Tax=unclassified Streptomyces TaxID=2593676 RepID=UPI00343632A9